MSLALVREEALPASSSAFQAVAALRDDLASTASGKGAAMVAYKSRATGSVAQTVKAALDEGASFYTFGAVGDGVADDTAALNLAINCCWAQGIQLRAVPGNFKTTGLTLTVLGTDRGKTLTLRGVGFGEPFYVPEPGASTVISRSTDGPVLHVVSPGTGLSAGMFDISGIYWEGNSSATPVIWFESFYGVCKFERNTIYQYGTGDGIWIDHSATSKIEHNYFVNRDMVAAGLGAARVGVGIYLRENYDAALCCIKHNTSRGFLTGIQIGAAAGPGNAYNAIVEYNELSVVYNGIYLSPYCRAAVVQGNYFEGGEGGSGIKDDGNWNRVISNFMLVGGFSTYYSCDEFTYGNVCANNIFLMSVASNQTGVSVTSSAANGGPGKVVTGNMIAMNGSLSGLTNVVGLKINGTDARINHSGNNFFPLGAWSGGSGTMKINLAGAASSDGTVGSGVYGLGFAQSANGAIEAPYVGRGAVNLAVDPTTVTGVTSSVLALSGLSVHTVDVGAVNITSVSAPNLPDKTFSVHFLANASRPTLKQGSLLKLLGSADYNVPAAGSWHTFQVKPGGVVWETSRVAY